MTITINPASYGKPDLLATYLQQQRPDKFKLPVVGRRVISTIPLIEKLRISGQLCSNLYI